MLILNGSAPILLNHTDTSLIVGTGEFFVFATASSLIFDATGNDSNPADLSFYDATNTARYVIGSNGNPNFQLGDTSFGDVLGSISFPNVFGTAASSVPDTGSTLAIFSLSLLGIGLGLNRFSRASITSSACRQ